MLSLARDMSGKLPVRVVSTLCVCLVVRSDFGNTGCARGIERIYLTDVLFPFVFPSGLDCEVRENSGRGGGVTRVRF